MAFEIDLPEDFFNGPNLVFLSGNVALAECKSLLGRPGADHVDGTLFDGVAATQALTIDGDNLIPEWLADGGEVGAQAVVKVIGIDHREDVGKGLGSGNSVGNFDPLAKPNELEFAEVFNLCEVIHPTQSRGNDHEEHFTKGMLFVFPGARVFQNLKRFKACWQAAGVVNFIGISRHLNRMTTLDIEYQSYDALSVVLSLA